MSDPKAAGGALRRAPGHCTLGVVDIGSSATRLAVAVADATVSPVQIAFERYPVRLGQVSFGQGTIAGAIDEAHAQALCEAAVRMRERMQRLRVTHKRAVATSAVREASNGALIAQRVGEALGTPVDILSGAEEARCAREALQHAVAHVQKPAAHTRVYLDLGGGSLELSRHDGHHSVSLPIGTVRLLGQRPRLAGPLDAAAVADEQHYVRARLHEALLAAAWAPGEVGGAEVLVGTGGNLQALCHVCPKPHQAVPAIDVEKARALLLQLAPLAAQARQARTHARDDRADLLLPALLVTLALAEAFAAHSVWVPGSGLRDTLMRRLWQQAIAPHRHKAGGAAPERV